MRKLLCWLGMCACRTASDDTGCWGECIHCGRRVGFVDRATLRAYADREMARERIRRGEPVSLAEGLLAIGATQADIISVHFPADETEVGDFELKKGTPHG